MNATLGLVLGNEYLILIRVIVLQALSVGSISEKIALIDCSCNNRRTQSSCAKRKAFTQQCFENGMRETAWFFVHFVVELLIVILLH